MAANITNRDRYPNVEFLLDDEIREVGSVGGDRLFLIGWEEGTDSAVVSRARTPYPLTEELFAIPLYELLTHSYDPVSIPNPLTRNGTQPS